MECRAKPLPPRAGSSVDTSLLDAGGLIQDGDVLLLRGGTRPTEIPADEGAAGPRLVTVEYKVLNIASIDTVDQSFYAEFVIVCSWYGRADHVLTTC